VTRRLGLALVAITLAPWRLGRRSSRRHSVNDHFDGLLTRPDDARVVDAAARSARRSSTLDRVSQLEQRYEEDDRSACRFRVVAGRHLVRPRARPGAAVLLGADSYAARLRAPGVRARASRSGSRPRGARRDARRARPRARSPATTAGALDDVLMRTTDFVMCCRRCTSALALRSSWPLVLSAAEVFALLGRSSRSSGAVHRARVRPSCARSGGSNMPPPRRRSRERSAAATRHLLPATARLPRRQSRSSSGVHHRGSDASYVGSGFRSGVNLLGTMLHDASKNIRVFADFSMAAQPGAAMFLSCWA